MNTFGNNNKVLFGDPSPMGGSECLAGGLAASSLTTFYFLCEVRNQTIEKGGGYKSKQTDLLIQ